MTANNYTNKPIGPNLSLASLYSSHVVTIWVLNCSLWIGMFTVSPLTSEVAKFSSLVHISKWFLVKRDIVRVNNLTIVELNGQGWESSTSWSKIGALVLTKRPLQIECVLHNYNKLTVFNHSYPTQVLQRLKVYLAEPANNCAETNGFAMVSL